MHGWQKEIMAKSHFLTSKILGFIVLFISGGMITGSCSDLLCCTGQRLLRRVLHCAQHLVEPKHVFQRDVWA